MIIFISIICSPTKSHQRVIYVYFHKSLLGLAFNTKHTNEYHGYSRLLWLGHSHYNK